MRFSVRKLEFRMPALGPNEAVTLAAFLLDEGGCPQRAVVRRDPALITPESRRDDTVAVVAVCQEIRSNADNPNALQTLVAALECASWSLTLTEPLPLSASTLDRAFEELTAALDKS